MQTGFVITHLSSICPQAQEQSSFITVCSHAHDGNHYCLIRRLEDPIRRSPVSEINTSFEMRHFCCPEGRHFLLVNLIVSERVRWVSASLWAHRPGRPSAQIWVSRTTFTQLVLESHLPQRIVLAIRMHVSLMFLLQAALMLLITYCNNRTL